MPLARPAARGRYGVRVPDRVIGDQHALGPEGEALLAPT
jgi:hypothetical protein